MKDALKEQYEEILQLLTSDQWKHWVSFVKRRHTYLQSKVNRFIREKKYDEAFAELRVMDDIRYQIDNFLTEKNQIKESLEKGESNGTS